MNYITTTDLPGAAVILGVSEDRALEIMNGAGIEPVNGGYLQFQIESLRDSRNFRGLK